MEEFISIVTRGLFFLSIGFVLYAFYYSYKVKCYVNLISDKLLRLLGYKYHYWSNPLLIPISLLKKSMDEDITVLRTKVIRLRIFFILAVILIMMSASLLSTIGE